MVEVVDKTLSITALLLWWTELLLLVQLLLLLMLTARTRMSLHHVVTCAI